MTTDTMTTEQLIERLHNQHRLAGTSVRCPRCGNGIGKFCRTPDGKPVIHPERVEAANR